MQVKDLTVAYPGKSPVIKGISFEAGCGAHFFLGPNGAGKTSLFLALAGLLDSQGEIFLDGQARNRKQRLGRVGFVFQNADDQLIAPSVAQEIAFGPLNLGWPKDRIDKVCQEMMARLDLSHLAHRPPHQLSGGEKKRLAIASALVMAPQCLILDEPEAGLDACQKRSLEEILSDLKKDTSLLIASHDLEFAWRLADEVHLIRSGELVASGSAREILRKANQLAKVGLSVPALAQLEALRSHGQSADNYDKKNSVR